ncbi:MAG: amidohydrolase family protein, partial [Deltaproteobacteria bacterium]|nr:amidohydrolase family protein [Deltaproteobacteria bacterium]
SVDLSDILAMATAGCSEALALDSEIGTLEPGKQATFLAVLLPDSVNNASDVCDYLVTTGSSMHPQWISS